jgi:hypothetical protein
MAKTTRQTFEIGDRVYFRRRPKGSLEPGTVVSLGERGSFYTGRSVPTVYVTPEPDATRWALEPDGRFIVENRRDRILPADVGRVEYDAMIQRSRVAATQAEQAEAAWVTFTFTPLGGAIVRLADTAGLTLKRSEYYALARAFADEYPAWAGSL